MAYVDFLSPIHRQTRRDYLARVNEFPKAEAARRAKEWGYDYWDGDRKTGYGGYRYDGRWRAVADGLATHYGLKAGDRVLDVGCGKGFLLYDLTQAVPGIEVQGIDVSSYAMEHAKEEVRPFLKIGTAAELPFEDHSFDLVISITTLHNLYCYELERALREIERVGRRHKYVVVESYRNEEEKANLLYWQLTS
jgi:protein-L-isoaspartate(D-aspartate) O-methyltransferase